jgi:hypothetical protein
MSTRNSNQGPTYIDPLFEIPEGLVNFEHSDVPLVDTPMNVVDDDSFLNDLDEAEAEDEAYITYEVNEEEPPELDFPDTFTIISQTIRTLASGMQVIDVVVDVETIPGAVNYEARVVKM